MFSKIMVLFIEMFTCQNWGLWFLYIYYIYIYIFIYIYIYMYINIYIYIYILGYISQKDLPTSPPSFKWQSKTWKNPKYNSLRNLCPVFKNTSPGPFYFLTLTSKREEAPVKRLHKVWTGRKKVGIMYVLK